MAKKSNNQDPKLFANITKDLQTTLVSMNTTLATLNTSFAAIADKTKEAGRAAYSWEKSLEGVRDLNRDMAQAQADEVKSAKVRTLVLKTGLDLQTARLMVEKQQALAAAQKEGISLRDLYNMKKEFDLAIKSGKEYAKAAKEEEKAAKIREKIKDATAWVEKYKKGWQNIVDILKTPQLAKAVFAEELYKKLDKVNESFEHFHHLGLTAGQSIQAMTKNFSIMSAIGLADNKGVIEGMVESYGNLNALTKDEVNQVGMLAHKMGVTGQEAFELVDAFSKMPGETMDTAIETAKFTKHLATVNGLAPGKLTKDMAKNTEAMALFSAKGAKGFAMAAVELHKMGVDISTANTMAQGLLNFEDSINKQMEASVLLGREINLDKARELSLNGDLEGATREVLKNIGSQAELEKMNVLQKQKLAEASGLTVDQLNKAMDAQQEYNKYHGEEASMWMNITGYAMDYRSKVGGFLKENGLLLVSTIQMLGTMSLAKIKDGMISAGLWAKEKAMWVWRKLAGVEDIAQTTASTASKLTQAGANSTLAASAAAAATAESTLATSTVAAGTAAKGAGAGLGGLFRSIGTGLNFLGQQLAMTTPAGVPVIVILMGLGATLMMIGAGAMMMGLGVMFAAKGFVMLIKAFSELSYDQLGKVALGMGILTASMYAMAPALLLLTVGSIGLLALSAFLLSAGAAAMMFGVGIALSADKIGVFGDNIKKLQVGEILKLGPALLLISAGLAAMAYTGLMAMPVIGALTALATVAPALVGLGNAIGGMFGGGENKKEDKMDKLIAKLDNFAAAVTKQQVVLKLDGTKVAESARLSTVTTGQR